MGFNTPILILNDHIHDIENNPKKAIDSISNACSTTPSELRESFQKRIGKGICTVGTAHADQIRIIYSYGNTMTDLISEKLYLGQKSESEKERLKQKAETVKHEMNKLIEEIENESK